MTEDEYLTCSEKYTYLSALSGEYDEEKKEGFIGGCKALCARFVAKQYQRDIYETICKFELLESEDPDFKKKVEAACRIYFQSSVLAPAIDRASNGYIEEVYHQGVVVGHKRRYPDSLCIKLLQMYNVLVDENSIEAAPDEKSFTATVVMPNIANSAEDWEKS